MWRGGWTDGGKDVHTLLVQGSFLCGCIIASAACHKTRWHKLIFLAAANDTVNTAEDYIMPNLQWKE